MMEFRGLELDFDIYDADQAEAYEDALQTVQEESAKKVPGEGLAAGIRRQCGIVFDFFDDLFGEGTHRQIFGEKVNLGICLDAFKEFTDLVNAQKDAMAAKVQQYTPNRETRRAIQKAARRSQPTAHPAPAAGGES